MAQILVIEDDPLVGKTLIDLLSLHGYQASGAESGEAGVQRLRKEVFDLVLLDIRLPGISGYETCERVREDHGPHLPVIMMTAFGDPAAVRRGYDAGADDFLHKPVDTPSLILKVRAFLRLKSLHDELVKSREDAQVRARDLARLQEIGRDWSLIAEPEDFSRMVTSRLAGLIGAPIVGIALNDPVTRTMEAALPVHGLDDTAARRFRYVARPEYRSLWSPRTGRPYVSNQPGDPRLAQEIGLLADAKSVVLVPMFSAGELVGLLGAADKPGGFTDGDVQLLSMVAGPVASFVRSRQIFDKQRRHATRLERLAALVGDMAAVSGRARLLELTVRRMQKDLGYERVAFHAPRDGDRLVLDAEAGARHGEAAPDSEALRWALRLSAPLEASRTEAFSELAVPVRAGDHALGVLVVRKRPAAAFDGEETHMLSTLAGPLALALRRAESEAATEHMARQMATLYDLGLETSALRDLHSLFVKATEEAGRLIEADHTSVFRMEEAEGVLRLFASWAREPGETLPDPKPTFKVGEGIAGRVARDLIPVLINDAEKHESFVRRGNPMSRILCVPLTHLDRERNGPVVFGVLNATRLPGLRALHERRPRLPDPLRRPALDRGGQLGGLHRGAPAQRPAPPRQRAPSRDRGEPAAGPHPGDGGAPHPRGLPLPGGLDPDPRHGVGPLPRRRRRQPRPASRGLGRVSDHPGRRRPRPEGEAHDPGAGGRGGARVLPLDGQHPQRSERARAVRRRGGGDPRRRERPAPCLRSRPGDHARDPGRRDRDHPAQRRALPGARGDERPAGRARPDEERAREHRGPRLPGPPVRDPGLGGAPGRQAGRAPRGAAGAEPGHRARGQPHGRPHGQDARDHPPGDRPLRLRLRPARPGRAREGCRHPLRLRPPASRRPRSPRVPAALLGGRRPAGRGAGEPAQQRGQVLAPGRRGAARRCGASARPRS